MKFDKESFLSDFKSCFTPGVIVGTIVLVALAGVVFWGIRKMSLGKKVLDAIPGKPGA